METGDEVIGKIFGLTSIFRRIGATLGRVANRVGKPANPTPVVSLLLTAVLALSILLPGIFSR